MDIQGTHSGLERSRKSYEEQQRALIDAYRALVRGARENLSAAARQQLADSHEARTESRRRDEIELTSAAQAASQPSTAEREARVRELTEAHRLERLHTPERIERAAQRLLEG